ncbi:hypothetical protein BKP35_08850 [Anaerobacillus arseniciselenatis]|uniref:HAMP domain-containing protein n=1 Tax=Anaerobacillus arseniciselenatis TaxID=85682 RepID=A0A1S2LP33_9BACI|nr:sensor histidine kinase [Anaerobacillus arseniciselenatis]OIJ13873.1 hypothetical protein BKP35_08850 [Anaerobacillus arseniciselenatis]
MNFLLGKYNTLRNQILIVYLFVMFITLIVVGTITYSIVLNLITDKSEGQMRQTAVEASGRIDSLYEQINNLSVQVATNSKLQQYLLDDLTGQTPSFSERQSLMEEVNRFLIYSNAIASFELYTKDFNKVIPLDEGLVTDRIERKWLIEANVANGGLVWIGEDPKDPEYFLAIRQVNLIDHSFGNGGYLLIQVNPNYFQLMDSQNSVPGEEYTILLDKNNEPIISNYIGDFEQLFEKNEGVIPIDGNDYMYVRQNSNYTGWTLVLLTPVKTLMEGVPILRTATILAGLFGFILFVILSYFLSTMITRPIFKLTRTMKNRGEGELVVNTDVPSTIEINELNTTYNEMVEEINHLIQEVYEKELSRNRTELKALQSQINPHFLFNTLNAIYWSLDEKGDDQLADLIVAMSELFRYTIDKNNSEEWVTVKQELNHVEQYMQIMKFRLENISWEIQVSKQYGNIKIPKLLIQPLVENAIIHGISNKIGQGRISVTIKKSSTENYLICEVRDNGKGIDKETVKLINNQLKTGETIIKSRNGIGVVNVDQRLKLYYPNTSAGLIISSEVNKGTCCQFKIPLKWEGNDGEENINR